MASRGGARGGLSLKVTQDLVRRLSAIRALWLTVNNDPDSSVQDLAGEFYFAVGQLLDGRVLEQIEFTKISRARVLAHDREG